MSRSTQGVVVGYHVGLKAQNSRECIVQFGLSSSIPETARLVGRKVALKERKSKFIGRIVGLHGRNGFVIVRFRKGVPGQALGTPVELCG